MIVINFGKYELLFWIWLNVYLIIFRLFLAQLKFQSDLRPYSFSFPKRTLSILLFLRPLFFITLYSTRLVWLCKMYEHIVATLRYLSLHGGVGNWSHHGCTQRFTSVFNLYCRSISILTTYYIIKLENLTLKTLVNKSNDERGWPHDDVEAHTHHVILSHNIWLVTCNRVKMRSMLKVQFTWLWIINFTRAWQIFENRF